MFPANIAQVMVEFVDEHVRIVEILFTRNVDGFFAMNITAKRSLFPLGKPDSEHRFLNPVV